MPVPFTLTELMALYFGRDMLKVFKDTAFYESLESLLQKVKTTLPPESIQYLNTGMDSNLTPAPKRSSLYFYICAGCFFRVTLH
jgi:hypothetical protein